MYASKRMWHTVYYVINRYSYLFDYLVSFLEQISWHSPRPPHSSRKYSIRNIGSSSWFKLMKMCPTKQIEYIFCSTRSDKSKKLTTEHRLRFGISIQDVVLKKIISSSIYKETKPSQGNKTPTSNILLTKF